MFNGITRTILRFLILSLLPLSAQAGQIWWLTDDPVPRCIRLTDRSFDDAFAASLNVFDVIRVVVYPMWETTDDGEAFQLFSLATKPIRGDKKMILFSIMTSQSGCEFMSKEILKEEKIMDENDENH